MSTAPQIAALLSATVERMVADHRLPPDAAQRQPRVQVGSSSQHGHFSSPLALSLAAMVPDSSPPQLAQRIVDEMEAPDWLERAEVAGPGYINFFLRAITAASTLLDVLAQGDDYGRAAATDERVLVEFVSSNPTGPVHIGHGRGAAVGDVLASLFEAAGATVQREYYVNDRGRQSLVLAVSAALRHFSLPLPQRAYQGDYVADLVAPEAELLDSASGLGEQMRQVLQAHSGGEGDEAIEEALLDTLIAALEKALGVETLAGLCRRLHERVLRGIEADLRRLNVEFDDWFSEASLFSGKSLPVAGCVERLLADGNAEKREDGAIWFLSSRCGDDKDRVLVRASGEPTYFASDIAYHMDKLERIDKQGRSCGRLVNVWGADHHGYEARLRGALQALGVPQERLRIIYVQFVALSRGGDRIGMSTRGASFVALSELLDSVPASSVRLMYLSCASGQHLDFDLDAALAQDRNNPAYYIQYAYARICSLQAKQREQKSAQLPATDAELLAVLTGDKEMQLQKSIARFPALLAEAAEQCEPHRLVVYLRNLAALFHSWYNAERMLAEDLRLRAARLALCAALKQVFANGLRILGLEAPQQM